MDELEALLNKIVNAKKGIDAAFVLDLGSGFLLDSSKTLEGRDPQLINALMGDGSGGPAFANMGIFNALQNMMDAFGQETRHGNLSSTILQFGDVKPFKGILVVYVYRLKNKMSLAIGFVNTRHDGDTLASMIFHCESNIKDVLKEVKEKYE